MKYITGSNNLKALESKVLLLIWESGWVRTGTTFGLLWVVTGLHHYVRHARVLRLKRNSAETASRRGNAKSSHAIPLTPHNLFFSFCLAQFLSCFSPLLIYTSPSSLHLMFLRIVSHIQVSHFFLPTVSLVISLSVQTDEAQQGRGKTELERGFTTPL